MDDALPIKRLILTVGLPRSGQSTWARNQKGAVIVCPDDIRFALYGQRWIGKMEPYVWATARTMVEALFRSGHDTIIVDATNNSKKRRDFWLPSDYHWKMGYRVIFCTREVCYERANATGQEDLLPVIDRMAREFEHLDQEERLGLIEGDLHE